MGASSSSPDKNEVGDEIFQFAESYLETDDIDTLEKITGMVISSFNCDSNELSNILRNDRNELERRVRECARVIEQSSYTNGSSRNDESPKCDFTTKRKDLINHFQRLYPAIDSYRVADELLKLSDSELNYIISTPSELKTFIKVCSLSEESEEAKKGATSSVLDTPEQLDRLKEDHLKELSKSEICKEDVVALIGSHLFKRISLVHPSKAELLTGILMEMERDVILQLLVSASILHLNIANVIKKLISGNKLSKRETVVMQEELGDLIYSVIEQDVEQETAGRITGMLLEIDLVCLHELLADDYIFKRRVKEALNACRSTSQ